MSNNYGQFNLRSDYAATLFSQLPSDIKVDYGLEEDIKFIKKELVEINLWRLKLHIPYKRVLGTGKLENGYCRLSIENEELRKIISLFIQTEENIEKLLENSDEYGPVV